MRGGSKPGEVLDIPQSWKLKRFLWRFVSAEVGFIRNRGVFRGGGAKGACAPPQIWRGNCPPPRQNFKRHYLLVKKMFLENISATPSISVLFRASYYVKRRFTKRRLTRHKSFKFPVLTGKVIKV